MNENHDKNDEFVFEQDDEELAFIEEDEQSHSEQWKILIVDDDADVHIATEHALTGIDLIGRIPTFLHAYSGQEGYEVMAENRDVAVVLLDVVMESDDAGLQLVGRIRKELNLLIPRIILRTGQPGYAPELDAIREYDINDYKTKNELTRNKLYIAVLASIRAYDQIKRMEVHRQGLEQIVQSSSELMLQTGLQSFSSGVIKQLSAFLSADPDSLVCAQSSLKEGASNDCFVIIAASGRFEQFIQRDLNEMDDEQIKKSLYHCFQARSHLFEKNYVVLNFPLRDKKQFAVYVKSPQIPSDFDRNLLEVFCKNVSICAENINLIGRLKDFAYFDKLVGLPNRVAFIEAINQCIADNASDGYCVILMDVDHFAEINNAFGHDYGDLLLIECAKRLSNAFGHHCTISRLSGDAFGLLGKSDYLTPERVRNVLKKAFQLSKDVNHTVSFSMGVVQLKDSVLDGHAVLKDAAIARKMAKGLGIGCDTHYSPEIGLKAKERTHLLQQLHGAFEHKKLHAVFQPQIDIASNQLLGFEALMRWKDDNGQYIAPDKFIPLAEQSGLIVGMGHWILLHSLRFIRELELEGWTDLCMCINVSAVQFRMPDFIDILTNAISETCANPEMVELEITESVAMMGQSLVVNTLQQVRDLGIAIAIDDFGTGFSSLSYLSDLPLDRLKIDKSFVNTICNESGDSRITDLIIKFAHSLNLRVIAEGVENEHQVKRLLDMGCREVQGYYYAKPMNSDDLKTWLMDWKAKH